MRWIQDVADRVHNPRHLLRKSRKPRIHAPRKGHNHFRLPHRGTGRSGLTYTSRSPVCTQPLDLVERPHKEGRSPTTPVAVSTCANRVSSLRRCTDSITAPSRSRSSEPAVNHACPRSLRATSNLTSSNSRGGSAACQSCISIVTAEVAKDRAAACGQQWRGRWRGTPTVCRARETNLVMACLCRGTSNRRSATCADPGSSCHRSRFSGEQLWRGRAAPTMRTASTR